MVLAVDLDNTRLEIGGFEGGALRFTARMSTDLSKTADQYTLDLLGLLTLYGSKPEQFEGAAIASVVPPLLPAVRQAVINCLKTDRVLVVSPGVKTGLNIKIEDAAVLGSDLACLGVGALEKYPPPCIILDLGTATTISALDREGKFLGGSIIPGVRLSLEALWQKAAQLPYINLESVGDVIGANTPDSMRSGIIYGTASMLDGMVQRYRELLGKEAFAVAAGDLAPLIVPYCRTSMAQDIHLRLEGLYHIYRKNRHQLRRL